MVRPGRKGLQGRVRAASWDRSGGFEGLGEGLRDKLAGDRSNVLLWGQCWLQKLRAAGGGGGRGELQGSPPGVGDTALTLKKKKKATAADSELA